MELVGEEKRIHALFSEARLADEQNTPRFAGVWNRAQSQTMRPQRAFKLSFVAATALLVCALVSLAWWSQRGQRNQNNAVVASVPSITTVGPSSVVQPAKGSEPAPLTRRNFSNRSRVLKLAARRQVVQLAAARKSLRDAKAIESWKSPTATLLVSSSDELLKSLPQLNQTVQELKSFLPNQPQ
ncbi:MAG: hypothetical protein QOH41_3354 [Blastocatellia bacterium]|jgi:hypothetical protein|nr:hypothetical protein [Blastocatellia bacterium]